MIWNFRKWSVLFGKGLNWVQRWVSHLGPFICSFHQFAFRAISFITIHCLWYFFFSSDFIAIIAWLQKAKQLSKNFRRWKIHAARVIKQRSSLKRYAVLLYMSNDSNELNKWKGDMQLIVVLHLSTMLLTFANVFPTFTATTEICRLQKTVCESQEWLCPFFGIHQSILEKLLQRFSWDFGQCKY